MFKALVFKELRETMWIAVAALLLYSAGIANLIGYVVLPFGIVRAFPRPMPEAIPFVDPEFLSWFLIVSVVFTTALGLWQTASESRYGTWLFLLHRPMGLRNLICVKMAVGTGLYLFISALAILAFAAWAATPGTHAGPFYWWMTATVWRFWIIIVLCYFGSFLAGIRSGRWLGTRLLPVPAAYILAFLIAYVVDYLEMAVLGLFGVCTCMCHFWQSDYIRGSKARFFITGDDYVQAQ